MPAQAPYATNEFGVNVKPMDFEAAGAPTSQVFHGLTIVSNDKMIGRINSWTPQAYQRDVNHVYELGYKTFGRPVDAIPGPARGFTASVARNEVWDNEFELTLGYDLMADLADQDRPFAIDEYLFKGDEIYRKWSYSGCWFQDKDVDGYQADGDGAIRINATILYVSRKLTGGTGRVSAV